MTIKNIEFKNFSSFGNKLQRIEFKDDEGMFYLVVGENGAGKCLNPETEIEIVFSNKNEEEAFKKFLNFPTPF